MKTLIAFLLQFLTVSCSAQLIQVSGWNASVHLPDNYSSTQLGFPAIIYIPPSSGVGTNVDDALLFGPGAYLAEGWDGNIDVNGVLVRFIVITLQPPSRFPSVPELKQRVDELQQLYRMSYINLTGIEHGGICVSSLVAAYPMIAKTVSNVTSMDTCCWRHFYNEGTINIGGALQSLYKWMAYKSAFGTVNLGSVSPGATVVRKPYFYYDNASRIIHLKPSQEEGYYLTNALGQVILKGKLKVGDNRISVTDISTGLYILKTEGKVFKIIIQ